MEKGVYKEKEDNRGKVKLDGGDLTNKTATSRGSN